MEASALTTASHSGLLARRSPLLRLQSDEKLVALIRDGHDRAFEVLFDRYGARLLAFCRHLVGSVQDAEDVLQEVFVAAHAAMLADNREIKARPWLYRIARNRCLNFLRRPIAEGQDSMDIHPHSNGTTTLEQVQSREEMRAIFADVHELPETQRTALVLREIDDLSYTEIAQAMGTTLPSVKSLLVRARMSLAEASEARVLTCDEVRLELAEAAEGLARVSGPARRHVRGCGRCHRYRRELRSSSRALTALAPFGLLAVVRKLIGAKVGGGATGSAAGGGAGMAGGGAAGGGAATAAASSGFGGAAIGGGGAGLAGAVGAKAAVGMATAALITAGAVGVKNFDATNSGDPRPAESSASIAPAGHWQPLHKSSQHNGTGGVSAAAAQRPTSDPAPGHPTTTAPPPSEPAPAPQPATSNDPQPADPGTTQSSATSSSSTDSGDATVAGSSTGDPTTGDPTPPPDPVPVPSSDPAPTTDPTAPPPDPTSPPPDSSMSSDQTSTAPATVVTDGRTL